MKRNMNPRYNTLAIALHWLLGLAILALLGAGLYMTGLPFSPERGRWFSWHKSVGLIVLMLSALRLLWRWYRQPPALPEQVLATMPRWQAQALHTTHTLLYLAFFAVPLTGWAYSSAAGYPVVWFGVRPLPDMIPVNEQLADQLKQWHHLFSYALAALVSLHVAAALKHHFIDRDGLLGRMGLGRGQSPCAR